MQQNVRKILEHEQIKLCCYSNLIAKYSKNSRNEINVQSLHLHTTYGELSIYIFKIESLLTVV